MKVSYVMRSLSNCSDWGEVPLSLVVLQGTPSIATQVNCCTLLHVVFTEMVSRMDPKKQLQPSLCTTSSHFGVCV